MTDLYDRIEDVKRNADSCTVRASAERTARDASIASLRTKYRAGQNPSSYSNELAMMRGAR